jgi:hypothetical protein
VTNWLIWLVFAAELVVLLAVAPDRWRWLRGHPLDVAIVVLTPPVLPPGLQALRVLCLLRLLRLVRAARIRVACSRLPGLAPPHEMGSPLDDSRGVAAACKKREPGGFPLPVSPEEGGARLAHT